MGGRAILILSHLRLALGTPEVVSVAVSQNGAALQHAAESLRSSRTTVLAAVSHNGLALRYASDALRADEDMGFRMPCLSGCCYESMPFLGRRLSLLPCASAARPCASRAMLARLHGLCLACWCFVGNQGMKGNMIPTFSNTFPDSLYYPGPLYRPHVTP